MARRKALLFLALSFCLCRAANAQFVDAETPTNALPVSGGTAWGLVFSDEFNTNALDTSKWGIDVSSSSRAARTDRGIADWWWKAANVSLDGSNLVIDVTKQDANTMHCGSISSDGKFEPMYGYLEARVQIADSHKDTHTAFWTQGPNMSNSAPNNNTAADGAEVDIFESAWFGDYTKSVVHRDGYDADHDANTVQYSAPGLHSGYHVFGLEWTATYMKIYYDGALKVTYTGSWVPQTNEWLWLSNGASFGDIGDFQTDPVGWLTCSKWDYVRVWQSVSNAAPVFTTDPVVKIAAVEYLPYSGSISNSATDAEGDAITYSKLSGPSWLSVAGDGTLSGTPANSDIGTNTWTIQAQDVNANTDTATLEIIVNAAGASMVIVGGNIMNGNFNAVTGTSVTFSATPEWYNMTGNQSQVATRSDVDYNGTQNAVIQSGRLHGMDTGYTIVEGDTFHISYVWKDDWTWVVATDEITYSLFVTSDNTITGTRTDLAVHHSGITDSPGSYEAEAENALYTASASDAGKTLFIAIETTSAGFSRVDEVELSVTPAPPFIIVTSSNSLSVAEGSTAAFGVRLYANPVNNATVNVARVSGDTDISVQSGAQLEFTPLNGTNWQQVTIAAAQDADWSNGDAIVRCSDPGGVAASVDVGVSEVDDDNIAPTVDAGTNQTVVVTGGGPWTPAQITMDAWYDAADTNTVTESGGSASQWNDKSGNGQHMVQAVGANQPGYSATNWDGSLPALTFDGAAHYLENSVLHTEATVTMAVVMEQATTANSDRSFGVRGVAATGKENCAFASDNTLRYDGAKSDARMIAPSVGKHLRVATRTVNSQTDFHDGSTNLNTALTLPSVNGYINAGNCAANLALFFSSKVAEGIIIFDTITPETRQQIEGYFAHKWGLDGSLPTNHPYKASAPGGVGATANLDATVTDDNGDTTTTIWTMVSGPGLVVFDDASAVDTVATFYTNGTYLLRLTADDGLAQTSNEVTITVNQAGADTCSLTVVSLHGNASPDGVSSPASNSTVNLSITDSPVGNGGTQYVCTGWAGTGSATSGSGTNTSFTITTDSTITWQWITNFFIELNVIGN